MQSWRFGNRIWTGSWFLSGGFSDKIFSSTRLNGIFSYSPLIRGNWECSKQGDNTTTLWNEYREQNEKHETAMHIVRMNEWHLAKESAIFSSYGDNKLFGRSRKRWADGVEEDLETLKSCMTGNREQLTDRLERNHSAVHWAWSHNVSKVKELFHPIRIIKYFR